MNTTQKNFKKQMRKAEIKQQKNAKRNRGVFSNRLFELRFYGYNGEYRKPQNLFVKTILLLLKIIRWVIIVGIFLFVLLIVIALIIELRKRQIF